MATYDQPSVDERDLDGILDDDNEEERVDRARDLADEAHPRQCSHCRCIEVEPGSDLCRECAYHFRGWPTAQPAPGTRHNPEA